jgi:hypothetical protein
MQNALYFRTSEIGHFMENEGPLTEPQKAILIEKFVWERYGRGGDILDRYIDKTNGTINQACDLYTKHHKTLFKRNEFPLSNRYIVGTPNLFTGPIIHEAGTTICIRHTWNIKEFFKKTINRPLVTHHYWKLQGHMALTGATSATIAYVLVNTPAGLIAEALTKLQREMRVTNPGTDKAFQRAATEYERMAIYDDIPLQERIIEMSIDRDDKAIERMYERIKFLRKWMDVNFNKQ